MIKLCQIILAVQLFVTQRAVVNIYCITHCNQGTSNLLAIRVVITICCGLSSSFTQLINRIIKPRNHLHITSTRLLKSAASHGATQSRVACQKRRSITWLSTVQQDLKQHHLMLPEAADLVQNRPLWRMMSTYGATQS